MPKAQGISLLKFLHASDWLNLEDLLDDPARLQMALAHHILDGLFRLGPQTELPLLKTYLGWHMARKVLKVLEEKLKRQYPHGASKRIRALQLEQAVAYLTDAWVQDFIKHPTDALALRCQRILPRLKKWPFKDMRAGPQHGTTSQLTYLALFEDVMKALNGLPRRPRNGHEERQRRAFLDQVLHPVRPAPGRAAWKFFHPETKELFFEIPDALSAREFARWARTLSKKDIALEITAAIATRTGAHLTPKTLHRLLPKLRAHRRRFDRALSRV